MKRRESYPQSNMKFMTAKQKGCMLSLASDVHVMK